MQVVVGYSVDEIVVPALVALAEKQDAIAGQAIASRSPGFLIIALDGLGQGVVDD